MRIWIRTFLLVQIWSCCEVAGFIIENRDNESYPEVSDHSWTHWYNIDDPKDDGNDIETASSLWQHGFRLCGTSTIVEAECRVYEASVSQDNSSGEISTICDKDGLQCYASGTSRCPNYEVRFRCQVDPLPPDDEPFHVDFKYYFILIIIPVLVLLLRIACPFYLQRGRGRLRSRQQNCETVEEAGTSPAEIIAALIAPPPSYVELFEDERNSNISQNLILPNVFSLLPPPPNYEEALEILRKGQTNTRDDNTHL
ncbi:hypothetical protein ScPMuIL_018172 [Solemya velum]